MTNTLIDELRAAAKRNSLSLHNRGLMAKAADALERKRGEWIEKDLDKFRKYSVTCPFCGAEYIDNYDGYVSVGDFNFCPNCGVDMRGECDG